MSEVVTLTTGGTGTIYGTLAAAVLYVDSTVGAAFRAWAEADPDTQKRTLLTAARYLNRQGWNTDAASFVARDAIAAFPEASYELAVAVLADDTALALAPGPDIASISDNGGSVTFASQLAPTPIHAAAFALVGGYLSAGVAGGPDGGFGVAGDCENPFSDDADFDLTGPF